jgi:hypothetical protein
VRVALRDQLRELLAARGSVPLKGLFRATAGAPQKEAKLAAEALVKDGAAVLVMMSSSYLSIILDARQPVHHIRKLPHQTDEERRLRVGTSAALLPVFQCAQVRSKKRGEQAA